MDDYEKLKFLIDELRKISYNNLSGLHIVVEDLNVEDGFINAALYDDIDKYSNTEDEKKLAKEIAELLLSKDYSTRKSLLKKYWNLCD